MTKLGFDHFAVVGRDQGARCAYHMAIDHPDVVTKLAVLDIVPTGESFTRADKEFALRYSVSSFLAAPAPIPEQLVAAAPDLIVNHMLDSSTTTPPPSPPNSAAPTSNPSRPRDHRRDLRGDRATATIDAAHDEEDRPRRPITCPVLVLWSATGATAAWYDPLSIWRDWADDVSGAPTGLRALPPRRGTRRHDPPPQELPAIADRCSTTVERAPRPCAAVVRPLRRDRLGGLTRIRGVGRPWGCLTLRPPLLGAVRSSVEGLVPGVGRQFGVQRGDGDAVLAHRRRPHAQLAQDPVGRATALPAGLALHQHVGAGVADLVVRIQTPQPRVTGQPRLTGARHERRAPIGGDQGGLHTLQQVLVVGLTPAWSTDGSAHPRSTRPGTAPGAAPAP